MSRLRADWQQSAALLSMLEGCRQGNVPFDPQKWVPASLMPPKERKPVTKEEAKAFSQHLNVTR